MNTTILRNRLDPTLYILQLAMMLSGRNRSTPSKIGGSKISSTDQDVIVETVRAELYKDSSLVHVEEKVKFGSTDISFDQDFNVSVMHPVLWTPSMPTAPYIVILSPDELTGAWDKCLKQIINKGFSNCAFRFYDASGASLTVPPSMVQFNGFMKTVNDPVF
ncbi:hypothetical protein RRF57_004810 [Xylaria bambusicola]|uniref:Uncharacterized protein n=1 Tax=Xylaria bambusicola TaxID=326684 RepID=A0AAN7UB98_9PEZI